MWRYWNGVDSGEQAGSHHIWQSRFSQSLHVDTEANVLESALR